MSDELNEAAIVDTYLGFMEIAIKNELTPREVAHSAMIAIVCASIQSKIPHEKFVGAVKEIADSYKEEWPIG
jgi:hypothetical protein